MCVCVRECDQFLKAKSVKNKNDTNIIKFGLGATEKETEIEWTEKWNKPTFSTEINNKCKFLLLLHVFHVVSEK